MLKNLPIRLKMAAIYLDMCLFTLPILFASYMSMRKLNELAGGAGDGIVSTFTWLYPVFIVVYLAATYALGRKLTTVMAFPLKDLVASAGQLANGNVDVQIRHESKDEIGMLAEEMRHMVAAMKMQAEVLRVISDGDYTCRIEIRSKEDVVNQAIAKMLDNNNQMIAAIRDAAHQVNSGAQQIASGAQTLATGSTQQAASIQQFSASLSQVQAQVEESAQKSDAVFKETQESGRLMNESLGHMAELTAAMHDIDESSANISKVIKVIDDIAFQTNILALNAAVEAARAGQHGKGFAVVADEVRNLASKSAAAAKETAVLIDSSVQKVHAGNALVEMTSRSLEEVGAIAAGNAEAMQKLRTAAVSQNEAVLEITQGIEHISAVVQANSATAEQSAATSEELSAQSNLLDRTVASYKLRNGEAGRLPPVVAGRNRQGIAQGGYSGR